MNIPIMVTNEIGNGNKIEIARHSTNDIPIHSNWLSRNCLLLLFELIYLTHLILYSLLPN